MAQINIKKSVELNEVEIIEILKDYYSKVHGVEFDKSYVNIGHKPCGTFEDYGNPTPILKSITLSN
jgi:hypothetical protein